MRADGLRAKLADDGDEWICGPFEVLAHARDEDGEAWGLLFKFRDKEGREHRWVMPKSLLAGDGAAIRERLLAGGLSLATGQRARQALLEYLALASPEHYVRFASRPGWHTNEIGLVFILPDQGYGLTSDERFELNDAAKQNHSFNVAGTLEGWRSEIGSLCEGNSRLVLAVSAAFAAPLLHLTDAESGGIHFCGASRTGKTTALYVAGSVWGGSTNPAGYINSWRATDNGLEPLAARHCDALLCLDEMGQVEAERAGEIAYMLANGQPKARARQDGTLRSAPAWRVFYLSTGEVKLSERMREANRVSRVGQDIRLVNLPADAGAGLGLFEALHDFPDADGLAHNLKGETRRWYGTASRAFLERLTAMIQSGSASLEDRWRRFREAFLAKHVPAKSHGQVTSVAARFALIAFAGELAIEWGITGWSVGEAERSAAQCFRDWFADWGSTGAGEIERGIMQVRAIIEKDGSARFELLGADLEGDQPAESKFRTMSRLGYRKRLPDGGFEHWVLPEAWKSVLCQGFNPREIAKALAERGMLRPAKSGSLSDNPKIAGRNQRVYILTPKIFDDGTSD